MDVDINALPPGLVCLPPGNNASPLSAIAISPDGALLAASGSDGVVRMLMLDCHGSSCSLEKRRVSVTEIELSASAHRFVADCRSVRLADLHLDDGAAGCILWPHGCCGCAAGGAAAAGVHLAVRTVRCCCRCTCGGCPTWEPPPTAQLRSLAASLHCQRRSLSALPRGRWCGRSYPQVPPLPRLPHTVTRKMYNFVRFILGLVGIGNVE